VASGFHNAPADQQKQLTELLEIILKNQNLTPGVHPGYRRIGPAGPRTENP